MSNFVKGGFNDGFSDLCECSRGAEIFYSQIHHFVFCSVLFSFEQQLKFRLYFTIFGGLSIAICILVSKMNDKKTYIC